MPQFVYSKLFTLNLVSKCDIPCMHENKSTYFHDKQCESIDLSMSCVRGKR